MTNDYFVSVIACIPWVGKTRKGSTENNHSNNIHFWTQLGRTTTQLIKRTCLQEKRWQPVTSLWAWHFSKAHSSRIWIFLNPQIFLSDCKNFHVHTLRIQIELSRPQVRGFTLISSAGLKSDLWLMRNFSHHSSAKKTFSLTKLSHQALVCSFNFLIGV